MWAVSTYCLELQLGGQRVGAGIIWKLLHSHAWLLAWDDRKAGLREDNPNYLGVSWASSLRGGHVLSRSCSREGLPEWDCSRRVEWAPRALYGMA